MCVSPKIKTPKVDTSQVRAIDPAPLTEEPKGVLFGGEEVDNTVNSEVPKGGKKSLKVKLETPTKTTGAVSPSKSIRSRVLN